ncbi:MAG: SLC13 family permease [Verrucomicrobiota bacterium]|nr:SLC13 family permease [Limisphaera sp.]MDW8383065.1 SLC13 family permease [Verrucomicrobiota bacterium]
MSPDSIALALILGAALYLFWTQVIRMDLTALAVMLALIVPWPRSDGQWRGILTPAEGFSGFGSVAVMMVVAMFVFGTALARTGVTEVWGLRLFRACARTEWGLQLAVLVATTLTSMFINDTTVVILYLPLILTLCRERGWSPSRFLMIAAYGALLGGQWTLIGTRSNILVGDILRQQTGQGLGFFDLTPVAAVVFVGCAVVLMLWGRRFLPAEKPGESLEERLAQHYLTEVMVTPRSAQLGRPIREVVSAMGSDVSWVGLVRGQERLPPADWLHLQAGDVLILQGPVSVIGGLLKSRDFQWQEELTIDDRTLRSVDLVTVEALLAPRSNYAGRTLEEMRFTQEYGFTLLGIARRGRSLEERPAQTALEEGDSLLLLGHVASLPRLAANPDLIVLAQQEFVPFNRSRAFLTLGLLAGIVVTAATEVLSPAISIPIAALLVVLTDCVKVRDLYRVVDWQAVVTAAGLIPFGLAVEKTGAARDCAEWAVQWLEGAGPTALLAALCLLAIGLTHFIDNSAVGIILAPVAYNVALILGVDPKPFMVGIAICISASFCTPFAHESTILVMGPGRYRFRHYLQAGGFMAVLTWVLTTWITPRVWPF